ncbi:hypothetical protein EJB05_47075, partial [Eragrostis curvula]
MAPPPSPPAPQRKKGETGLTRIVDRSLGTAANLSKLLPTGTTLAFQTMAPSFSRGGDCMDHGVNYIFTWLLIGFLTFLCAMMSFTDSITDKEGNTYYGVVTLNGLKLFNANLSDLSRFDEEEERRLRELMHRKRLRWRDFLHAFFRSAVFMALAFCDGGVQRCLVPLESWQWKSFLTNLPLAVGFVAGFLFMIFPSSRNGIGDEGRPTEDGDSAQHAALPQTTEDITITG